MFNRFYIRRPTTDDFDILLQGLLTRREVLDVDGVLGVLDEVHVDGAVAVPAPAGTHGAALDLGHRRQGEGRGEAVGVEPEEDHAVVHLERVRLRRLVVVGILGVCVG